jgi:DNA-binding NarL/FixJ family response regulator
VQLLMSPSETEVEPLAIGRRSHARCQGSVRHSRPGRVPGREATIAQALALIEQARELSGSPEPFSLVDAADGELIADLTERASLTLFDAVANLGSHADVERGTAIARTLHGLHEVASRLRVDDLSRRAVGLERVHHAIKRLNGSAALNSLLEIAPAEAAKACGFDRAVSFRVRDRKLVPTAAYVAHPADAARELLGALRATRLPIALLPAESELMRRRATAVVQPSLEGHGGPSPLAAALFTPAYVAAPIVSDQGVIGFIHADRAPSRRRLDAIDRDLLRAFAGGLASALERAMLTELAQAQRDHLRRTLRAADIELDELSGRTLATIEWAEGNHRTGSGSVAPSALREVGADARLTSRERQVLVLMATGATNGRIADQLVVTEGTVKVHVSNILRKLGAANRAEAVSKHLRMQSSG